MGEHAIDIMIFVSFLTPIAAAVTEVLKMTFTSIPQRFNTLLAILVSIVLAALSGVFTDLDITMRLWSGLFAGLASAKVYDITKNLVTTDKK